MMRTLLLAGASLLLAAGLSVLGCAADYGGDPTKGSSTGNAAGTTGGGGDGGGTGTEQAPASKRWGSDGSLGLAQASPTNDVTNLPACTSGLAPLPFFMSADDSNSMASPAIAREWLHAGKAPPAEQIRTYELLNYYNPIYELPDPATGKLGIHVEMMPEAPAPGTGALRFRLQVGVQAFQIPRVPLVLTYVIDTSGSLVGTGMDRTRAALGAIGSHLQKGDMVNVVTWSNKDSTLLEGYLAHGDQSDQNKLAEVVTSLVPGGGSDLHAGLERGYKLANEHFDEHKINRVVLLSDGGANLGVTDQARIAASAAAAQNDGIYLVGIGVGPANGYSDSLMNLVTDAGRGAYVYLDTPEEAKSIFDNHFDEIMNVAARDVQVEVDLPPYLDIEEFYGETYSQDKSQVDPQNLAPGDSMIFNETLIVTDLSKLCGGDTISVTARWETPIEHAGRDASSTPATLTELLAAAPSPQMLKANAIIAYAEALKTGNSGDLAAAQKVVSDAMTLDPKDTDLAEIASLLALHPALTK